jgi:hypothetical protein
MEGRKVVAVDAIEHSVPGYADNWPDEKIDPGAILGPTRNRIRDGADAFNCIVPIGI